MIEVSDTTVSFDRTEKCSIYARAGISEVWLVNLPGQCVEVYTQPHDEGYGTMRVVRSGMLLTATALADISLPVSQVLVE